MRSLHWRQVHAWRLSQHGLSPRLGRRGLVQAVARPGGVQAQVMSAAELAIWARADGLTREHVGTALWKQRTLVKTWAMRAALHLLPAGELPLYTAARAASPDRNWPGYFAYYGLKPRQQDAYLAAVPEVLGSEPMTREELADAVADSIGLPAARKLILSSGWGSPLKPSAFRGDLCFGPSRGQSVTFVNPRKWLKGWDRVEPQAALLEIARRYFRAYGPGTRETFARWWGLRLSTGTRVLEALAAEMEQVEVEGWRGLALCDTVEAMQAAKGDGAVNLVPLFDAYTFGFGRHLGPILASTHESRVFRPQGWVTAAVIVGGCIKGTWEQKRRGQDTIVNIRAFEPLAPGVRRRIVAEAERLTGFLGGDVAVRYE
jgi:hypothetical protein